MGEIIDHFFDKFQSIMPELVKGDRSHTGNFVFSTNPYNVHIDTGSRHYRDHDPNTVPYKQIIIPKIQEDLRTFNECIRHNFIDSYYDSPFLYDSNSASIILSLSISPITLRVNSFKRCLVLGSPRSSIK